jgi:high-affinity Fe2+/Pb2+ permease
VSELRGKGWRVLGYFIWMLGAGVVLDSEAIGTGGVMLAVGAGLFLLGTVQSLRGGSGL